MRDIQQIIEEIRSRHEAHSKVPMKNWTHEWHVICEEDRAVLLAIIEQGERNDI